MMGRWRQEREDAFKALTEDEYAAYLLIKHEQALKSAQNQQR
jgi:hypothetical protein